MAQRADSTFKPAGAPAAWPANPPPNCAKPGFAQEQIANQAVFWYDVDSSRSPFILSLITSILCVKLVDVNRAISAAKESLTPNVQAVIKILPDALVRKKRNSEKEKEALSLFFFYLRTDFGNCKNRKQVSIRVVFKLVRSLASHMNKSPKKQFFGRIKT